MGDAYRGTWLCAAIKEGYGILLGSWTYSGVGPMSWVFDVRCACASEVFRGPISIRVAQTVQKDAGVQGQSQEGRRLGLGVAKSERAIKVTVLGALYWENSPSIDGDRDMGREEGIWRQEAPGGITEQQLKADLEAWRPRNREGYRFRGCFCNRSFNGRGGNRGSHRTWETPYLVGKKRKEGGETSEKIISSLGQGPCLSQQP